MSTAIATAQPRSAVTVTSPDGNVAIQFVMKDTPTYSVSYRGKPVILDSRLGLTLQGSGPLSTNLVIRGVREDTRNGSWKPVYGERSSIPENYREAVIDLEEQVAPQRLLQISIRAYNEGAAFRYTIPKQKALTDFVILSEQSEFHIPDGTRAWETHGAQRQFENVWTKDIQPQCERPLAIEYPDGTHVALVEAGLRNYARMLFSPVPGKPGTLFSDLSGGPTAGAYPDPGGVSKMPTEAAGKPYVWGTAPFSSPWRAAIVGDRPGDLLERNYLLLNLSEPSVFKDTSWIKSGKVMREVTMSTTGAKQLIDFAKQRKLQYIEFDAGWYGSEYDDASDATGVHLAPGRGPLDLQEVINYGKEQGIGVLLYVNRRALEKQLGAILPLYEKWGVKGMKFGFVNVGSQYWTKWLYDAVELAGKHKMMVDIHDEHRPTGVSRTLPNLLTQEGIAGNETMPTPDHNTVLPFTRFVAGAADYTICYFNDRIKTTRAQQLALAAVYYSPFQFMYWYDRPASYNGEPEVEFFDRIPTVWDDTKVVDGQIGRFITVARRSGRDWFVGSINNGVPRKIAVPLSFLPAGQKFIAHLYENGAKDKDVRMSKREVDSKTVIDASLRAGGGQAIWLEAAPWRIEPAEVTDAKLPRVLLIGDSVMSAYRSTVYKNLAGKANVDAWINPYNQAHSGLPEYIQKVIANGPYDVIHFNLGLHGWAKGRIPEGQFEPLMRKYVEALRTNAPRAALIWASTTPVTVKGKPLEFDPEINATILEHNALAAKVMRDFKIPINDLYKLTSPHLELAAGDGFHWKREASESMGAAVSAVIQAHLPH